MEEPAVTPAQSQGHGLLCPTCQIDLVMSERQGIEIDYCPKCRGVWLDRGELDKIIEQSLSSDISGAERPPGSAPVQQEQSYSGRGSYDDGHGFSRYGHGGHGRGRRHESFLGRLFD